MLSNKVDTFRQLLLLTAEANTPYEWRKSSKLVVAAILALSLWAFLGSIAHAHFSASREFANQIATADSNKVSQIEKAALHHDSTFKTLYALITPLATAATGYFFIASGSPSVSLKKGAGDKLDSLNDDSD